MAACADAGRPDDPNPGGVDASLQLGQQLLRPSHGAAQAVADADGHGRRGCLALLHHVEVVVEGGDLVDLGLRQPQLLGQRRHVLGRDMAVAVLDQVQELDQQVAPARAVAQSSRT